MHPKIAEILKNLSSDHGDYFKAFKELEPNRFVVKTPLTESSDHITYFTFEITNDVLRLEMSHIFGSIDDGTNLRGKDLLELLIENNGTFRMTSAYLAIREIHEMNNGALYTSLQTYGTFLMKWASADIAELISLQFFDIKRPLTLGSTMDPWPASIRILGDGTYKLSCLSRLYLGDLEEECLQRMLHKPFACDKKVRSALIHRSYASGSSGKRWLEAFLYSSYDPNVEEEDPVAGLIMSSDGYVEVGEPDHILLPAIKIMVAKATRSGRRA